MLRIPPIQSGFSSIHNIAFAQTNTTSMGQSIGGTEGRATGVPTIPGSTANVVSEVGRMLQSIGGGIEGNKSLQMLIALMIFMALLQGSQGNQQQAQAGMELLGALGGAASNNGGDSMSLYVEQTNISISSTTLIAQFSEGFESGSALGQQLDMAI
jgi:hypothetical protein